MKTKSNNNPSKLQSEAVLEFRTKFVREDNYQTGVNRIDGFVVPENIEQFLSDQIQKAYSKGREEERIFVMAIYHKAVEELFNKEIADNITKHAGIVYKKYKLSIQSKGKIKYEQ